MLQSYGYDPRKDCISRTEVSEGINFYYDFFENMQSNFVCSDQAELVDIKLKSEIEPQ